MTSQYYSDPKEQVQLSLSAAVLSDKYNLEIDEAEIVAAWLEGSDELDEEIYEKLFTHFCDSGEMPYGIAKARTGDPVEWIRERLNA